MCSERIHTLTLLLALLDDQSGRRCYACVFCVFSQAGKKMLGINVNLEVKQICELLLDSVGLAAEERIWYLIMTVPEVALEPMCLSLLSFSFFLFYVFEPSFNIFQLFLISGAYHIHFTNPRLFALLHNCLELGCKLSRVLLFMGSVVDHNHVARL